MSTSAASTATAVVVGESLVDVLGADRVPGGSPLNVAVGLARLGVPTTLLTQLGADADGDLIRAHAEASGVTVRAQPVPRTGTAVATVGDDGSADYAFDIAWTWDPRSGPAPAADLFHCGSLAAFLAPGAAGVDALLAEAADRGALTSFDPNIRPVLLPDAATVWERTRVVAARCDLVKLSDEDAAFLAPGAADPGAEVARALVGGRTRLVVVTQGPRGCLVATPGGVRPLPAGPPVEVADTVGAGDSFMAAMLTRVAARRAAGLPPIPDDDDLPALVAAADAAARVTVTRPGADPPWRDEVAGLPGW